MSERRRPIGQRLVRRRAARMVLAALAALAGGCVLLSVAPAPDVRTGLGTVELDRRSGRRLAVAEHTARRDERGHLVVRVRFRNASDKPCRARLRVEFFAPAGGPQEGQGGEEACEFRPGFTDLEWTSYRADATNYRIRVLGEGGFPW